MGNSSADALNAGLCSTHRFGWNWRIEQLESVKRNGRKVFSCFSCGGGSSMGYKLAGYDVVGNCELDRDVEKVYLANNHPKLTYNMDIRDFRNVKELPEELFSLDILDGSPPCSTFSMAGLREDGWSKKKEFREGQKKQRLDDLFFEFIALADRLRPKVVVAENVKGLLCGNARGYVSDIVRKFGISGYDVQIYLLNSVSMGVPQRRERCFFVARRGDLGLPKLQMKFSERPIFFGDVRTQNGCMKMSEHERRMMAARRDCDKCLADINTRLRQKSSGFTSPIVSDMAVCPTVTSAGSFFRMYDGQKFSRQDFINVQSFPQDYDFLGEEPQYICGMSVPPVMMANIARSIYEQWFDED